MKNKNTLLDDFMKIFKNINCDNLYVRAGSVSVNVSNSESDAI